MKKLKLISFNYIISLLLILIFIYSVYIFICPHEAFAMEPHDILRSFNPDTYIYHEIDGTPIELRDTMGDPRTYHGKLHYEAEKARQLYENSKHKLYTEAKRKQRSCGTEHPVYHRKVLDLPKTDHFNDNKCTIKSMFSKISSFVDNKPSGAMDPK